MKKISYFIKSAVFPADYPDHSLKEVIMVGRSNVGKSSLINGLLSREIAKVSQTPGKTQTLNFFSKEDKYCIVDLPGFGFAALSKSQRADWQKMINNYIKNREQLTGALILADSRRQLEKEEIQFAKYLDSLSIPYVIVVTKSDKLKKNEFNLIKKEYENLSLDNIFFVSSLSGNGIVDLEDYVFKNWIKQ